MEIIDTHCHMNDSKMLPLADEILERAKSAGVRYIMNTGDSLPSFETIISLKHRYPDICRAVLGIHPEYASESDEYFNEAYRYIREHRDEIDAIGEIGLDYHYGKEEETVRNQKRRFIEQISLAKELNLPIVIHARDADYDTYQIIREELPPKMDLHCYSGSKELLSEYLKLPIEVHIGIGGVSTFKNARTIKEVISFHSMNVFMTETDAPYLAPVPHRGEMNESSYIPLVIKTIAEIKNMDIEACAEWLYQNGTSFYGIK